MALHFLDTGDCSVDQFSKDPAHGLLVRLQLFKLADFLEMLNPQLQEENFECFKMEVEDVYFGMSRLSAIVAFLYNAENARISYIRDCRPEVCLPIAMAEQVCALFEDPLEFWETMNSNRKFAKDVRKANGGDDLGYLDCF
jgi:hypothetical protein